MKFPYQDQFKHLGPVVTDADGSHYIDAGPTKRERTKQEGWQEVKDGYFKRKTNELVNTVAEAKQNAKGETWKVIIQWSSHTITAETCEKYEVRKK